MKKTPNFYCTICWHGFTRAENGRRHVRTVESGKGHIITAANYQAKLSLGKIPQPVQKSPRQFNKKERTWEEIAQEEFIRGFYQRMGALKYEQLFKDKGEIGKLYREMADKLYNMMKDKEYLQIIDTEAGHAVLPNNPEKTKKFNKFVQSILDSHANNKSQKNDK